MPDAGRVGEATWIGVDIGTSAVKAVAVTGTGHVVARASAPHETRFGPAGYAEQDPGDYVRGAITVMRAVAEGHAVAGIGIVGQTPTLILVDSAERPIRPALTWLDRRATDEALALEHAFGDATPWIGGGLPWDPTYPPAKLAWLSNHEANVVRRTRWVLQPKDYVGLVLTGQAASDVWSSKGLGRVDVAEPAEAVLRFAGWTPRILPELKSPWSLRGGLRPAVATEIGLPSGLPVAVGWSDALGAMLAVGAFTTPTAFVLTGTSDIVGVSTRCIPDETKPLLKIPGSCAPIAVAYGPTTSSGGSISWAAGVLGLSEAELVAMGSACGDEDVPVFVPYLAGERAPVWRPVARGSLRELRSGHGRPHLARAVMNGVALSARHILDVAREDLGLAFSEVHLAGRAAADPLWQPVRLETLGVPLVVHGETDVSAAGGAILGACASTGGLPGELAARMSGTTTQVRPTRSQEARSAGLIAQYLRAVEDELAREEPVRDAS